MSKTLTHCLNNDTTGRKVKVYYDSEYGEYSCVLFECNVRNNNADYFTNNEADALGTAEAMLNHST